MITSKKIIISTASMIFLGFITSLFLIRKDLELVVSKAQAANPFREIAVKSFDRIEFSTYWTANIKQGNEYKVEVSALADSLAVKPTVENNNGTLYFKRENSDTTHIKVKIIVPELQSIKAMQGTKINLDNFVSDSINVVLENGSAMTGIDSRFKKLSIKTFGDAWFEFVNANNN